ncbi:MAG: CapA family protein [Thermoleophilia bacterium]|nr:CapA family protein [Thermoleophilia bacterium]
MTFVRTRAKARALVLARSLTCALVLAMSAGVTAQAYGVEPAPVDPASPADPAPPAPPALPPPTLASGMRDGASGPFVACAGLAGACTVGTPRGRVLELRATPPESGAGATVVLEVSWRPPGSRRLRPRAPRTMMLGADAAGATIALPTIVQAAGTWCIRARLRDAAGTVVASTPAATCVRWRPPIELGWAGDIVVGSHYGLPPNGGRDQFSFVDQLLRAPELMIGNYEGTLSRGGASRCSGGPLCFIFQAPPERARNLRDAGFDVMNLANNHGLDKGADARRQTVAALARVGIASAGLPGRVTIVRVQDTNVGIVGMSPYPGTTNMRSSTEIFALVADARRRADVVVVAMHAGLEGAAGAHVPHGADYGTDTRGATHTAIDAGADVVFGSGPHVVRGIERYRDRYIVYSSGNFAGWHNFGIGGLTAQSGVVRMTFDYRGRPTAAAWDGVILRGPGIPHVDRSGDVVRRVAALSREDFGRRGVRFTRDGSFR